jgi:hypothetical protein
MRALNIERITAPPSRRRNSSGRWRTTSAHSEFEAQVYRTSENRTVMQARKESLGANCWESPPR